MKRYSSIRGLDSVLLLMVLVGLLMGNTASAIDSEGGVPCVRIATSSELNREAFFWYRLPTKGKARGILLLVPGFNGDGRGMLGEAEPWVRFADEMGLVLVGPTFQTSLEEVQTRRGYYYPELWSGEATLKAVEQIRKAAGMDSKGEGSENGKVMIFGFSAGAHFAHRFALWKPEKVTAFVAYSAGWWDEPTASLRNTPGLIMCGQADERFGPSFEFFSNGQRLGLPLIWRGYRDVGHELTPQIIKMAQAFLGFYAERRSNPEQTGETFIGDLQSYRFYPKDAPELESIPAESRVVLPSREVAEVWQMENTQEDLKKP